MTKRLSLDEIAERLTLPKTTVYYWIKDLPLERERKCTEGQRKGTAFWGALPRRGPPCSPVGVDPPSVRLCAKSNSGQLRSRVWRCAHGVTSVTVHDTYFRNRLQAWIDRVHETWG